MDVKEFQKDFYILDDGKVRSFLIVGVLRAILIDTGFLEDHIIDEVQKITNKKVDVILTHGDKDHIGGLRDFKRCYIHPRDAHFIDYPLSINYIKEKDIFSIGDYCFEIIEIPGHSDGSIALLDRKKKLLLSGDSVQKGPIYMFGRHRHLDLYIESLKKISKYQDIETILPSHHDYPLSKEYISYCLQDAIALKNHELKGIQHPTMPCFHYQGKHIDFYYEKESDEI